jgi:hypothetical protein
MTVSACVSLYWSADKPMVFDQATVKLSVTIITRNATELSLGHIAGADSSLDTLEKPHVKRLSYVR